MRLFTCLIGVGLALGLAAGVAAQFIPGDIDDDGFFDIVDTVVLRRALIDLDPGITQRCVLPATGQTTAFGPGSDGDVQAGAPLSYTDNGDGTITDNNTGLMWEKKDDSGGIHDWDNSYDWSPGRNEMDGTITTVFLADLNAGGGFAGHTDWRIPNFKELVSILDLGRFDPPLDPVFNTGCAPGCTVTTCSCTNACSYWSATSRGSGSAWGVEMDRGVVFDFGKDVFECVRAVRGGL